MLSQFNLYLFYVYLCVLCSLFGIFNSLGVRACFVLDMFQAISDLPTTSMLGYVRLYLRFVDKESEAHGSKLTSQGHKIKKFVCQGMN